MKAVQEQQQLECNEYAYRPLTTKHRRAGSTGTTGDEEYTTDEEELYVDEADCTQSGGLHPPHPILKSDLARAATDLFGYAAKTEEEDEPTSLFDEDEAKFLSHGSTKTTPIYSYNEKLHGVLSIHRTTEAEMPDFKRHLELRLKDAGAVVRTGDNDEDSEKSRLCIAKDIQELQTEGLSLPTTLQWGRAVAEVKEHAVTKLQEELKRAHEELKLKDEEVSRLSRIRQDVEAELEELTASLFQEAHNMVRKANVRQATAERLLEESRMKAEVLAAEVVALKTLVLTSTPARPNPHLHPQIDTKGRSGNSEESQQGLFTKKHRRSPSHFNLKYGRESSPPDSPLREQWPSLSAEREVTEMDRRKEECRDLGLEVDPRVHTEFLRWKANPCVDKGDPFVGRVFREDIDLCLDFPNVELAGKVRQAVLDGIVFIEAVSDKTKLAFPKKCALLEAPRQCHYRMRLGDQESQWHYISQICRNRIIAVCDFLNYLRYIERGLVKSSVHDVYWEITRLRKEMVLARLGLALSS